MEEKGHIPDGDFVVVAQLGGNQNPLVVQKSAVGTAQIFQKPAPALLAQTGVLTRNAFAGDDDLTLHRAAQRGRAGDNGMLVAVWVGEEGDGFV